MMNRLSDTLLAAFTGAALTYVFMVGFNASTAASHTPVSLAGLAVGVLLVLVGWTRFLHREAYVSVPVDRVASNDAALEYEFPQAA